MADLELVRITIAPEGCFGVLYRHGIPCGQVTLERTWPVAETAQNGPQFVKIPPGEYRCQRTQYIHGGYETFEVTGVAGHSRLLFHAGNNETDSEGCILIGQRFAPTSSFLPGVQNSRLAMVEFMHITAGFEAFQLLVKNPA